MKLARDLLQYRGFRTLEAPTAEDGIEMARAHRPDLILMDNQLPGMDGVAALKALREDPSTRDLRVVALTAFAMKEDHERFLAAGFAGHLVKPIEIKTFPDQVRQFCQGRAGPAAVLATSAAPRDGGLASARILVVDKAELLARVQSLLRIKRYQDTIQAQTSELADLNRTLEARVAEQVQDIERLSHLQRFLSPQIAETIRSRPDALETHRREITVCFCDLRGFTAFSEMAEPEDIMSVLREYHAALGEIIFKYEGTLEHFAGDGMMVYFNDPIPCDDPAVRAVQMALAMRDRARDLTASWKRHGHQLGFGVGIAMGYATLVASASRAASTTAPSAPLRTPPLACLVRRQRIRSWWRSACGRRWRAVSPAMRSAIWS